MFLLFMRQITEQDIPRMIILSNCTFTINTITYTHIYARTHTQMALEISANKLPLMIDQNQRRRFPRAFGMECRLTG